MAYRILTAAALCVALAAPALAYEDVCVKPVSQLNLEQIETCKAMAAFEAGTKAFIDKGLYEERLREERRAYPVRPECRKENACLRISQ